MKLFNLLIIFIFLCNCSFDNKTGIWKNNTDTGQKEEKSLLSEFESLTTKNNVFKKIIQLDDNFNFQLSSTSNNSKWTDIFFNKSNNYENFLYDNNNNLIFKSKRVTKNKVHEYLLYEDKNVITSDIKGNIIVFSINENKIKRKFNFYNKKYKKKEKILEYFKILNSSNLLKEQKDLLSLKKALYLIKNSDTKSGMKLLNQLKDENLNLKPIILEILEN